MAAADGRPRTRAELDGRIEREFGLGQGCASASSAMAAAIVAKLLPSGATKRGSALRLRCGQASTRFTNDVGVARSGTDGRVSRARPRRFPATGPTTHSGATPWRPTSSGSPISASRGQTSCWKSATTSLATRTNPSARGIQQTTPLVYGEASPWVPYNYP